VQYQLSNVHVVRSLLDHPVAGRLAADQDDLGGLGPPVAREVAVLRVLVPRAELPLDHLAVGRVVRPAREIPIRRSRRPGRDLARHSIPHRAGESGVT
jgi:hypothetical protein